MLQTRFTYYPLAKELTKETTLIEYHKRSSVNARFDPIFGA